ncbi:PorP/SprF family type IX secretion system membrane protein [Pedobacter sp. MW01-1-1]|uniref:PorP/SprF family type IX secretion system membrane protein n=1 Tax=Pedobacter sp. MW01-1-1 TaxID=3383027 RepID=UPI003FEF7A81
MKKIYILFLITALSSSVFGQINPLGSIYYQNPYVLNPAMAGLEKGWELNGALKAQWTAIEGAPIMQSITAAYGGKRMAFGVNFYNDKAGVLNRTSLKGTYAYHLPLNDTGTFLDFGLSGGILSEYIDFAKVRADLGDVSLFGYGDRKLYFDGDFGVTFRTKTLTLQTAIPNLKRFFKHDNIRNVADRALFMTSAAYKFINEGASVLQEIEPLVMYRRVENYDDIVDVGTNLQFFQRKLQISGIYHTTNSVTIGAGTVYRKQLSILTQYTTNTSDLQGYSNGEFEIALKYNFR